MSTSGSNAEFLSCFFATMARQRIERMIRGQKLTLEAKTNYSDLEIFGDYISIIMLWSSLGAVFLKIHFSQPAATELAAGGLEKNKDDVSREMALDFMKECGNGVGGFVRSLLESMNVPMGMSLPFLADGKDEATFRKIRDNRSICSASKLNFEGGGGVIFTSEVCILEPKLLDRIRPILEKAMEDGEKPEDGGEVDFLF